MSTVEGRVLAGEALGAEYCGATCASRWRFQAGVEHLLDALKVTGFIEVGPHPVLRDYLLQNAKARAVPVTVLTTLRRPRGDTGEPEIVLDAADGVCRLPNGLASRRGWRHGHRVDCGCPRTRGSGCATGAVATVCRTRCRRANASTRCSAGGPSAAATVWRTWPTCRCSAISPTT